LVCTLRIAAQTFRHGMLLLVKIAVRREALDTFHAFERAAARVMAKYGGAIERVILLSAGDLPDVHREVHVVSFPDRAAFDAYRADPALTALAPLRAQAVLDTKVEEGEEGPSYA
jgi:hypothetical protein